jgi:Uma2 family endonuclease
MLTASVIKELTPQRSRMSYEEYLELASDSKIMEWVDGEVIIYMPPIERHQSLILFFSALLQSFIQFFDLGVLIPAPFEVKLWPGGPSREPDIIFISHENRAKLSDSRFEGGPDLVIEIISPSSVTEDRVHKFTEYERAGVREYWIIDPRPRQQHVDIYVLGTDQVYRPAPIDDKGIFYSVVISNFWFNIDWLWQENLPNPQLALAEIILSIEELPAETKAAYQTMYNLLIKKG